MCLWATESSPGDRLWCLKACPQIVFGAFWRASPDSPTAAMWSIVFEETRASRPEGDVKHRPGLSSHTPPDGGPSAEHRLRRGQEPSPPEGDVEHRLRQAASLGLCSISPKAADGLRTERAMWSIVFEETKNHHHHHYHHGTCSRGDECPSGRKLVCAHGALKAWLAALCPSISLLEGS